METNKKLNCVKCKLINGKSENNNWYRAILLYCHEVNLTFKISYFRQPSEFHHGDDDDLFFRND